MLDNQKHNYILILYITYICTADDSNSLTNYMFRPCI